MNQFTIESTESPPMVWSMSPMATVVSTNSPTNVGVNRLVTYGLLSAVAVMHVVAAVASVGVLTRTTNTAATEDEIP
jgi:hypothetical protein